MLTALGHKNDKTVAQSKICLLALCYFCWMC